MGLFSSSKKTHVASTVYNLAGDVALRPDYLKATLIGAVTAPGQRDIGEVLTQSYLNGPGLRLRGFSRWAERSGYNTALGLVTGQISNENTVNLTVLQNYLQQSTGSPVQVALAETNYGDYSYWVDQYLLSYHPGRVDSDYSMDIDDTSQLITLTFPDDGAVLAFTPTNFSATARYLYVLYQVEFEGETAALEPGTAITLAPDQAFPDISAWQENQHQSQLQTRMLTESLRVQVTYSDERPGSDETYSQTAEYSYLERSGEWERTRYQGTLPTGSGTWSLREVQTQSQTAEVEVQTRVETETVELDDGVVRILTRTITSEVLVPVRSYRIDTQQLIHRSWSNPRVLIYREGSGDPLLDGLFHGVSGADRFYPFIPVRINKRFLSPGHYGELYDRSRQAFKQATSGDYDQIIADIGDSDSIDDIHYTYTVFGCALNTPDRVSQEYLYLFLQRLARQAPPTDQTRYSLWRRGWEEARTGAGRREAWYQAQSDPTHPLYNTPAPALRSYPTLPKNQLVIRSGGDQAEIRFHTTLEWNFIEESSGTGLAKPGAKPGELWFEPADTEQFYIAVYFDPFDYSAPNYIYYTPRPTHTVERVYLYWQRSPTRWQRLELVGLVHHNTVYNGKAVTITAKAALADPEESGFILPLHEGIFRQLGLVKQTQLTTSCVYLVFNSYQITKKKWYQTSAFKILIIVGAIAITVLSSGTGAGILGPAASIGTSLGFTGVTALIVGAIANAVAAMVVLNLIQRGAVALFGDRIGTIVGFIAGAVALYYGTSLANNEGLALRFTELMKAEHLWQLSLAAGEGYAGYMNLKALDYAERTEEVQLAYTEAAAEIQARMLELLGGKSLLLDPLMMAGVADQSPFHPEPLDTFLSRSLMTGSDIAEMSLQLLSNFADITLSTDLT